MERRAARHGNIYILMMGSIAGAFSTTSRLNDLAGLMNAPLLVFAHKFSIQQILVRSMVVA